MRARALTLMMMVVLIGCDESSPDDAGAGMDAGDVDSGGAGTDAGAGQDAGDVDAGDIDAGEGTDAGDVDAGEGTDAGDVDAGDVDAGPVCGGMTVGSCATAECLCCPAGGPSENCLCTTACSDDDDCTDAARPVCNRPMMGGPGGGGPGICTTAEFTCRWGAICAAPDTPIATPDGERAIAELEVGDLVYTMHEGALVARPLIQVGRTPVVDHAVVRAVLASGRTLLISGPHPTADGRMFSDLGPGDALDGVAIVEVQTVAYEHAFTHDILPGSDTGTYVAAGVLIGSTLTP